MPRARDRFGLGVGPEVRRLRPRKPKRPPTCVHPLCAHRMAEPLAPGRSVCGSCAERIDRRAAELREAQARKDAT